MEADLFNQTNTSTSCITETTVDRHISATVNSLFFIVGFPANCLSLFVAWMLMRKGNSMAVYLVTLSISDLLYTITLPVWTELALSRPIQGSFCSLVAVVTNNSFYVSSGLLCCISVDRYLALVYPLHFHWVRKVQTAAAVSVAFSTSVTVLHIILLNHAGKLQAFSSSDLCVAHTPMFQEDADVALTGVILGFWVPLIIMTFCFLQIIQALQQSTIQMEECRKVGLLLFSLLMTYVVAFAPFQTVMLLRAILEPGNCTWATRLRDPYVVTGVTSSLNSTLDPIIYCLISENAQREIKNAFRGMLESFQRMKFSWSRNAQTIQSVS